MATQPTLKRHPRSAKGAMSITVVQACLILGAMTVAAISVGRVALQSQELDNGSDAVALTCLQIAKTQGLNALDNGNHIAVGTIAQANSRSGSVLSANCDRLVRTEDGRLAIASDTSSNYLIDQELVKNEDGEAVEGDIDSESAATIYQFEASNFEMPEPKFVLVLDYSGSMAANFGGNTRIDSLRLAVNEMLDLGADLIEFGLVMFDAAVSRVIEVDYDPDQDIIRAALNSRGPGGSTNYADPLNTAVDLLPRGGAAEAPTYILFIGDGQPNKPNNPESSARAAAARAWQAGHTVFTLNIGGGAGPRDLLVSMTGDANLHPNPNYYFEVNNLNQLRAAFGDIEDSLMCKVGPIDPRPESCDGMHAFIVEGDIEYKLYQVPNAGDPNLANERVFEAMCQQNGNDPVYIRMNRRTCNQLIDEGGKLVVRYGRPKIVAGLPNP